MGIPEIIMIAIFGLSLGINLAKDGEPKDENYSFLTALFSVIISATILYFGGFWS